MSRPIAVIVSNPTPLSGQTNRSSGNFSTEWYGTAQQMQVEVYNNPNAGDIQFNIMEDKSGHDPVVYKNVTAGEMLKFKEESNFYIANPRNANGQNFEVKLIPA